MKKSRAITESQRVTAPPPSTIKLEESEIKAASCYNDSKPTARFLIQRSRDAFWTIKLKTGFP